MNTVHINRKLWLYISVRYNNKVFGIDLFIKYDKEYEKIKANFFMLITLSVLSSFSFSRSLISNCSNTLHLPESKSLKILCL